jgi:hypothetical protein
MRYFKFLYGRNTGGESALKSDGWKRDSDLFEMGGPKVWLR